MSTKISELPSATSLTGTEEIPIVQTGTTKKATVQQISADNYSTSEHVVGTWIDGKPLYEKTVEIPAQTFPAFSMTTIPHNISNYEFGFVVNAGFYYTSQVSGLNTYMSGEYYTNSASYDNNKIFFISVTNVNPTNIFVANCKPYSPTLINGGFAIIRYTKTTDNAS